MIMLTIFGISCSLFYLAWGCNRRESENIPFSCSVNASQSLTHFVSIDLYPSERRTKSSSFSDISIEPVAGLVSKEHHDCDHVKERRINKRRKISRKRTAHFFISSFHATSTLLTVKSQPLSSFASCSGSISRKWGYIIEVKWCTLSVTIFWYQEILHSYYITNSWLKHHHLQTMIF